MLLKLLRAGRDGNRTVPLVCPTNSLAGTLSGEAVHVSKPPGVNECLARARHLVVEPFSLVRPTVSSHGGQAAVGRPSYRRRERAAVGRGTDIN